MRGVGLGSRRSGRRLSIRAGPLSRRFSVRSGASICRTMWPVRCCGFIPPARGTRTARQSVSPAMIAAMRTIRGDDLVAVHRTRLSPEGQKVDRRMLGPAAGAAVKLDPDEAVSMGLIIGEGIETCLAARQLGFQPVWATGSSGGIRAFPVLSGVEALTVLAEVDANGANERAINECGARWHAAGRDVIVAAPQSGKDINDALRAGGSE